MFVCVCWAMEAPSLDGDCPCHLDGPGGSRRPPPAALLISIIHPGSSGDLGGSGSSQQCHWWSLRSGWRIPSDQLWSAVHHMVIEMNCLLTGIICTAMGKESRPGSRRIFQDSFENPFNFLPSEYQIVKILSAIFQQSFKNPKESLKNPQESSKNLQESK